MIYEYFVIVLKSLASRKLRSWLTVVGIILGVAAIISLITINQALQASIEESFEQFGTDKIIIFPKSIGAPGTSFEGLTTDDLETVESIKEFEWVIPNLMKNGKLEFAREIKVQRVVGIPADRAALYFEDFGIDFISGQVFTDNSKKIVLGPRAAEDLFDRSLQVRDKLKLEGEKFQVIGILESLGNPDDDNLIYIPMDLARDVFDDDEAVSLMFAKVREGQDIELAANKVVTRLERERGNKDFEVFTPEQLLSQLGAITGILQVVLVGIGGISLIVGAVGIMNSMYMSVLERTKEIGIMKAVGAKNSDVLVMFLLESALMGLVGGVIGVALGILIGKLVGVAAAQAGFGFLVVEVQLSIVIFGLLFALFVGTASGAMPARQAALLNPVDALRK